MAALRRADPSFSLSSSPSLSTLLTSLFSYGSSICNSRRLVDWGYAVEANCGVDGSCANTVQLRLDVPHDNSSPSPGDAAAAAGTETSAAAAAAPEASGRASVDALLVVRQAAAAAAEAAAMIEEMLANLPQRPSKSSTSAERADALRGVTGVEAGSSWCEESMRVCRVSESRGDAPTRAALSFLRRAHASDADIAVLRKAWARSNEAAKGRLNVQPLETWVRKASERVISVQNERCALEALANAARLQLKRYATTLEANVAELASNELAPLSRRRCALILIVGEKKILRFFCTLFDVCRDLLAMQPAAREAAIAELCAEKGGGDAIVRFVTAMEAELH